jgi:Na+-driven multidrug efflux pump
MVVVMGQDMGARDIPAAKRHFKQLTIWMYAVMLVYNVGILLTMPLIMGLFELTPEALRYGQLFGTIFCTADILLWIPSYGTPNALRAAGDAAFTMWIGVFSMWLIRVGMAYVFAYVFGIGPVSVWISMCCEWFVRAIFFTVRYKKGKWQSKRVI